MNEQDTLSLHIYCIFIPFQWEFVKAELPLRTRGSQPLCKEKVLKLDCIILVAMILKRIASSLVVLT